MVRIFVLLAMIVSSFHGAYTFWSFLLRILPQPHLISTYLGPNVPPATLFYSFPNCSCAYSYMSQTVKSNFERDYVTAALLVPWWISCKRESKKGKVCIKTKSMNVHVEIFDRVSTGLLQLSSGTVIDPLCLPSGHWQYFSWSADVADCCLRLIQNVKENWIRFATSVYVISGVGTELSRRKLRVF